jgi:tRNA threonylcarbamoyladenosine biosynthesis protein TsaE
MKISQAVKKILKLLTSQRIFLLCGELGAGKTKLTKIIAKKLKIKETLTSPTFILWQKYEFKIKRKRYFFNHLDLYRIKAEDILKLDLRKEINKKENIFFIEWGEKLKLYLKKRKIKYVEVIIKKQGKKRDYLIKNESLFDRC